MNWSPVKRHRGSLLILLGFVCLLNPFIVSALDLGDPDYFRYEPAQVSFYDNGTYDVPVHADGIDSDVACFDHVPDRACILERAIHSHGGLQYEGVSEPFLDTDYEYVYVYGDGFFEPVTEETVNETVNYALRSVPQSQALERISTPFNRASNPIQTALETGSYETSDEIAGANELIRYEGGFYVVYATTSHWEEGDRRSIVIVLQWIVGVLGAILILRGQRLRITTNR